MAPQPEEKSLERAPKPLLRQTAQLLSYLLHPFVVPLYLLLVLLFSRSIYAYFPLGVKGYLVGMGILFCWVIPGLSLLLMRHFGLLDNLQIQERRERILPLLSGATSYLACALIFARVPSLMLMSKMMMGASGCALLTMLTTLKWKISLHLTCLGGATALMAILTIGEVLQLLQPLLAAILCSGLLASARLYLGCHNGYQILAGYTGGFLIMSLSLLL